MAIISVYKTATIPAVADTDSIEFEAGTTAVTGGLDLHALTEGVSGITIARSWAADIGSSSSPLLVDVDSGASAIFWNNSGGGALYYTPNGDNNLCLKFRMTGFGSAVFVGSSGTITQLEVARGQVIIGSSITVTTIYQSGGTIVHQGTSGTAPTTLNIFGGSYSSERGATTLNISGGSASFNSATNTIGTINCYGGTIDLQRSGTITNFNLFGGSQFNFNIGKSITITNTALSAAVDQSSAFSQHSRITFTNAPTWIFANGANF